MTDLIFPYLVTLLGIFTVAISFPKVRTQTIGRLQKQDIVPKFKSKKGKNEIIYGAGQNTSLLFIGIIITIFGIFLIFNK